MVNNRGLNKDRFTAAMEEHNKDFVLNGQPDAVRHACNKCLHTYTTEEGETCKHINKMVAQIFDKTL
jgi:hypothetical protein